MFRNIGNKLYSDFTVDREKSQLENIIYQQEGITNAVNAGLEVVTDGGNYYTLNNSSAMLRLDLLGRNFAIIDDTIPFYSIAMHGYVDYAPDSINLSSDYVTTLLSAVENGAGLQFTFMYEDLMALNNTNSTHYYGASYSAWKDMHLIYTLNIMIA